MTEEPVLYDVGGVLRPRPFDTGRLGHFGLYAEDAAATVRFYSDLLGLRITDRLTREDGTTFGTFLTYNSDHHAMVIIDAEIGKARSDAYGRGVTVNQISFQVSTLQELVDANAMLLREGSPIIRIGRDVPGSNWAVYFTDPDAHTVELFYGMEQIGWDRLSKPLSSFGSYRSMSFPELPGESERDEIRAVLAAGGSTTGGTQSDDPHESRYDVGGVLLPRPFKVVNSGPISLFVQDLDASIAFYRDRMGLGVTEYGEYAGEPIAHLRTGTEHHTITLVPLALREQLGLPSRTTLMAYGLQVGSYRQLCDAADFLADHGFKAIDVPRELHTGIDYAVHVLDPEGHCVQIYHEMEQVGSSGRPLTAAERAIVTDPLPAHLIAPPRPTPNRTFQGPIG